MIFSRSAKVYLLAFLAALAVPSGLAVVSKSPGIHSTPGIWLMLFGLPGIGFGWWLGSMFGQNDQVVYIGTALANWVFYVCLVKFVIWRMGKFRKTAHAPAPK